MHGRTARFVTAFRIRLSLGYRKRGIFFDDLSTNQTKGYQTHDRATHAGWRDTFSMSNFIASTQEEPYAYETITYPRLRW